MPPRAPGTPLGAALRETPMQEQAFAVNLLENLVVPTFVLDAQARVVIWNRACERLTGIPAGEVLGTSNHWQGFYDAPRPTLADLVLEGRNADVNDLYNEHNAPTEERFGLSAENWCDMPRLGTRRYLAIDAGPIYDHRGRLVAVVETLRDVTVRKQAQRALHEADRRKDEFLAMLAHELRNPLAPISLSAELLKMTRMDEAGIRKTSEVIARQVDHMTRLVDDLLDVSRVTRGLVTLKNARVDMCGAVTDAAEQSQPLIQARGHRLTIDSENATLHVNGDRTRLVQVITNLLNNAARYTPEGGEIRLRMRAQGDMAEIVVRDNGIGIGAELLPHVFDLFTQGERSPDRSQGGLGMGLALVKSIVELHGGAAFAASDGRGKGSEFTIRLPLAGNAATVEDDHDKQVVPRPRGGLNLLVVDDNEDAACMLARYLEVNGHTATVQHDALTALSQARSRPPDAIILDIGLPDMDGYMLARRLRAAPESAHCVLIALTGYGQAPDLRRARSAGIDHHLTKPADCARLLVLLGGIAPVRRAPPPDTSGARL